MPCLYAIERSVPRKTSRSKPDNTPAIWSWCFPINCSTAFLHSFTMCRVQTTRILRRQERLTLRLRQRRPVEGAAGGGGGGWGGGGGGGGVWGGVGGGGWYLWWAGSRQRWRVRSRWRASPL